MTEAELGLGVLNGMASALAMWGTVALGAVAAFLLGLVFMKILGLLD